MKSFLLSTALALVLTAQAGAQETSGVPFSAWSQATPNSSANPYSVGALESPTNFQVPRGHIRVWEPFAGNLGLDATPNIFWNGTQSATQFLGLEIPDDAIAAQLVLMNGSTVGAITLTNAAVSQSSQWAVPGYTGLTPGITPYDASGAALTSMQLFSFGNNGVDSPPNLGYQTAVPANATNAVTSSTTATGSVVLNFSSLACPANGSTIAIVTNGTSTGNPALFPGTTVSSCVVNTSITMSQNPRATVNSGVTVYFIPPGITIAAPTNAPLPTLAFSDWAPVPNVTPRLDGPVMSGMTILRNGVPLSGTVSSTTSTAAVMSGSLVSDIPPATSLQACRAATISGSYTPNNQIQFANTVTNIVAGMNVWFGSVGPVSSVGRSNTVASVATAANTVVTMNNNIDDFGASNSIGSASTWNYGLYATVTNVSGSTITVSSAAGLSNGFAIYQGNGGGIGVNGANYAGTISSIASNVITMNVAPPAGIVNGMSLLFYTTAVSNAATAVGITPTYTSPPQNVYQGMQIVGTNIDPATYLWYFGGTLAWSHPPSAPLTNNQTVYFCNNVTTAADSPAGQPNINFSQTNYPNRLLLLRLNFSTANVSYWGSTSNMLAAYVNTPGTPWNIVGGRCTFGTDGVLTVTNITNTGGGCSALATWAPVWAVKTYSPRRGVTLAVVGDSHVEGDTTSNNNANFVLRAASLLNNPAKLPVSHMNLAWGGQPSMVYGPKAMQMIKSVQPEIVVIQQTTPNDASTAFASANMQATAEGIAAYVRSYGGLPVLVPDYQRQKYGCNIANSTLDAIRTQAETLLNSAASAGTPTLDLPALLADSINGASFFDPTNTFECIHANDNGHAAMAAGLVSLLKPYLRY